MAQTVDLVKARMDLYGRGGLSVETQRQIVDELMEARLQIHQHDHEFQTWRSEKGVSIIQTTAALTQALKSGWTWEQYRFARDRRVSA